MPGRAVFTASLGEIPRTHPDDQEILVLDVSRTKLGGAIATMESVLYDIIFVSHRKWPGVVRTHHLPHSIHP